MLRTSASTAGGNYIPGERNVKSNNNNPRAAAVPSLSTETGRDPERVWLGRVQQFYDPRAFQWVLKVHAGRSQKYSTKDR